MLVISKYYNAVFYTIADYGLNMPWYGSQLTLGHFYRTEMARAGVMAYISGSKEILLLRATAEGEKGLSY